jgi:hypothetical protein
MQALYERTGEPTQFFHVCCARQGMGVIDMGSKKGKKGNF